MFRLSFKLLMMKNISIKKAEMEISSNSHNWLMKTLKTFLHLDSTQKKHSFLLIPNIWGQCILMSVDSKSTLT
jgi:hypothetical protein